MDKKIYARGKYEESRDKLDTLRYEYRALALSATKAISICEVGKQSLLYDDLGELDGAMPILIRLKSLKPQIQKLQKEVADLQTTWNFG